MTTERPDEDTALWAARARSALFAESNRRCSSNTCLQRAKCAARATPWEERHFAVFRAIATSDAHENRQEKDEYLAPVRARWTRTRTGEGESDDGPAPVRAGEAARLAPVGRATHDMVKKKAAPKKSAAPATPAAPAAARRASTRERAPSKKAAAAAADDDGERGDAPLELEVGEVASDEKNDENEGAEGDDGQLELNAAAGEFRKEAPPPPPAPEARQAPRAAHRRATRKSSGPSPRR